MPDLYRIVRSVGFRIDPERAHGAGLWAHSWLPPVHGRPTTTPTVVMGLEFPNVVGLAAGYDKDARAWRGLARLGFGHIELGTVTPRSQPGNPRPRIFRLPADGALINRLGFPSQGAAAVAARLGGSRPGGVVLGLSIGPNGFRDPDRAADDYEQLVDRFAPLVDYLAINISSPNTPGLRMLETGDLLGDVLGRIVARRDRQVAALHRPVPLVVKLSPDIPVPDLPATVRSIEAAGIDGIVVTNTTTRRPGLAADRMDEAGGLSGAPLTSLSLAALREVQRLTSLPLIASGGVMTVDDAQQRLEAGASLVQLFTGFVYAGPRLVRSVARLVPRPMTDSGQRRETQ